ncbi:MAG: endonuclease MutS2 [Bacillota bacterium]
MDDRVLRRLEFDLVRQRLARHTASAIGRQLAESLAPAAEPETIKRLLVQTAEARNLLRLEPGFDFGGWHDIREELKRLSHGAVLEAGDLCRVADNLGAARRVKSFLSGRATSYPTLKQIAGDLKPFPELEEELKTSVRPPGEVADEASVLLADTRRRIERAKVNIKEALDAFVRSPAWQKYLQDPIVTIREGRYVLPVKVEHRDKVKGLVHDQSASGATLFIEPMSVVEKGNEIRRLEAVEKRETERILAKLSASVGIAAEEILDSTEILGRLDLILAKGRYSTVLNAVPPVLSPDPVIELKKARHPLLKGKAVPVDIRLGKDFDTLVVTGPNTGGKTVTLKTVGLCVLMAQAGLEVPAAEDSVIGVFEAVFADIGDEQSISENLSTFSSHLRNITEILEKAGQKALVLLDELGAGTDPREGAALGCAILEELGRRGAKTIASTHSGELKEFAAGRSRVENASVEFNPQTLTPTYRLVIGQPGRSNAFEIARGLGLPEEFVARAKEFLNPEERRLREMIQELEQARHGAEAAAAEAVRLKHETAVIKTEYESKLEDLLTRKEKLLDEAREEAGAVSRRARREAETIIRDFREKIKRENRREQEMAIQEARSQLDLLNGRFPQPAPSIRQSGFPGEVEPGEAVYLPRFGQEGTVVSLAKEGTVTVQVGSFKVEVPLETIKIAVKRDVSAGVSYTGGGAVSPTLDLRGQRVDEALVNLEGYLDDALLAGLGRVDIIHGFGTGALRAAVKEYLQGHPRVESFRPGGHGEGGGGVTVVEFK